MSRRTGKRDQFRYCMYCSSANHKRKFVSIKSFIISKFPEISLPEEDCMNVHVGTCKSRMYEILNKGELPCHMDMRLNGDIFKYFLHCKHPLHLHHLHRSSLIPCSAHKQRIILHSAVYWQNIWMLETKVPTTPSYLTELDKELIRDNDIPYYLQFISKCATTNQKW
jgi:hypothetical protein